MEVAVQTLWSVKGGVGVTVTSAALAAGWARRGRDVLLVDLCGDAPAVLGMAEPGGPGVRDWLATVDGSADALERLTLPVAEGMSLLPCGASSTEPSPARVAALVAALRGAPASVVVDGGRCRGPAGSSAHDRLVGALADAGESLLVTRACYLALRRALTVGVRADGAVLVEDPGRCIDRHSVADVLGLPVRAVVESDPAVARSVDAGLIARRHHRMVDRALRELW
jgi:Mrp family chromosome partitioning ATPase